MNVADSHMGTWRATRRTRDARPACHAGLPGNDCNYERCGRLHRRMRTGYFLTRSHCTGFGTLLSPADSTDPRAFRLLRGRTTRASPPASW